MESGNTDEGEAQGVTLGLEGGDEIPGGTGLEDRGWRTEDGGRGEHSSLSGPFWYRNISDFYFW